MIRSLTQQDTSQAMTLWLEGNLDAHPFIPAAYWHDHIPEVTEQLAQAECYGWFDGARLLGFVGMQDAYLAGLFVARQARSQGVGTALLDHIKAIRPTFMLQVYRENQRAAAFYRREGLTVIAEGTDPDTGAAELTMTWHPPTPSESGGCACLIAPSAAKSSVRSQMGSPLTPMDAAVQGNPEDAVG